ncbi:MAG: hypothetical protein DYG94_09470 [Leptolyngbya sp. PLA3]|nr:MAG: hypothetical protein EDM82_11860 [Cyanobacteria bacterium CYA]MCE7968959.1 hypothetical protein [Leptolyngbya sp. PL-A3]
MFRQTHLVCTLIVSASVASAQTQYINCARGTNSTGVAKADFHATLVAKNNQKIKLLTGASGPVLRRLNDNTEVRATVTNNNTSEVQIDWVLDVPNGVEIRYGAAGNGPKVDQVEIKDVHFTPRANARDNMPLMGWRVDDVGNVYLLNSWSEAVHFENLLFTLTSEPLSLDEGFDLLENPTGIVGLVSSGEISGTMSEDPSEMLVGQFAFPTGSAVAIVFDVAFVATDYSALTARQVLGTGGVPSPGSLAPLALLAIATFPRRRPH